VVTLEALATVLALTTLQGCLTTEEQ